jgi:hypothetical protein
MELRARLLALYLPQYYPTPENDEWWGPGFTEWTNVASARRLFRGHDQPHVPGELGFYDLRLAETRAAQAELARTHGVEAFCYWHYWFGGRRILERTFTEVVDSGEPRFPFCLAWANQSWTGSWYGDVNRELIRQEYPGTDDYRRHFDAVVAAMHDERYVRVQDKPVFFVFRPTELPNASEFADVWRERARECGLPGLFLVGMDHGEGWESGTANFDARVPIRLNQIFRLKALSPMLRMRRLAARRAWYRRLDDAMFRKPLHVYRYDRAIKQLLPDRLSPMDYPCVIPNWDHTPRSGRRGSVLTDSTPSGWAEHLDDAICSIEARPPEQRLVLVKSWNEWAEGNYLEPDRRWGRAYLEATWQTVSKQPEHTADEPAPG